MSNGNIVRRARAEGRETHVQGRNQALRQVISKLLSHRFGPLPAGIAEVLEQASSAELERWIDQAFGVRTLDELFVEAAR